MTHFYFGTCEAIFGVEIFHTDRFVLFCTCLFIVGVISELISFVKLCFSKILVVNNEIKTKASRKKTSDESVTNKKLGFSSLQQGSMILSSASSNKVFYNSIEMQSPISSQSSASSSKSLVSMTESFSCEEAKTTLKANSTDVNHLSNYGAHFDLIKFHPTDLISNLELIRKLNQIERNSFTRFDFYIKSIFKFFELVVGYGLMLIVMTFNFWFFLSLVLGYTFGYFIIYSDAFNLNFFLISNIAQLYAKIKNTKIC